MSNLEVNIQSDISIDELCAAREAGYSVQRSAHIGNMQPYNMALASVGIPMLLVDHTITGVDKTYRPEQRLQDLEEEIIAPLGCLASRTLVNDGRDYLDDIHIASLRDALPAADIETTTEYARRNESIYRAVIETALIEMPEIFSRIVSENRVKKDQLRDPRTLVDCMGIMQLNDDPRSGTAVMLPNEVDIIANYIIEAISSDADVIYHISGPDMVRYSTRGEKADELARLYVASAKNPLLGPLLPRDKLTVELVPAADARLATTTERSPVLEEVINQYMAMRELKDEYSARRAELFKGPQRDDSAAKTKLIEEEKSVIKQALVELGDVTASCEYLFCGYQESAYISQYDVSNEGGLYISPLNTSLSLRELTIISNEIKKIIGANKNDRTTA